MTRYGALAVIVTLAMGAGWTAHGEFEPAKNYEERAKHGFTVRVSPALLEEPDLADETLRVLDQQVFDMVRRLPEDAVEKLRRDIPIWVELEDSRLRAAMCYHVSAGWLAANGYNPEKARSVEVSNARAFVAHTLDQPSMVLHEFAHAWHHNFTEDGYDNARIAEAHEAAQDSGKYDEVLHISGRTQRHYGLTSPMEHFAELSEAYFGVNDFEPFVRGQLQHFDPEGYALIEEKWGLAEPSEEAEEKDAPSREKEEDQAPKDGAPE